MVIVKKLMVFEVWFFERFAKPNRPKNNMGASLGFFGLVRPLLRVIAQSVTDSESLGMTRNMKSNFKLA